jgi:hypothetical protein
MIAVYKTGTGHETAANTRVRSSRGTARAAR